MQPFCSDVVVQNANVISSPVCKVVCFKKCFTYEVFYVRKIIVIITTITIIIIIVIISIINFNININIIIITIIIKFTTTISSSSSSIITTLSFIFSFFDIRSLVCHLGIWIHLCFVDKYFYWRFISWPFISYLLLALVFWKILLLSIRNFPNL